MIRLRQAFAILLSLTRAWPLSASFVYVLIFCVFSYLFIDRPLALAIKSAIRPETENFFKSITVLGDATGYLVVAAVALLILRTLAHSSLKTTHFQRYRAWGRSALYALLVMASSGILVNLLKFLIGRIRPRHLFEQGLYGFQPLNTDWGMNSFPSGHSQAIFAAMMALYFIYPRYDAAYLALAFLIALSRVMITVHYLSDTVMGAWLAIAAAVLWRRYYSAKGHDIQIRLKRDARLFPGNED
ncbi:MAG: phosphatase PAP2 family protein [Alphaproteobacteria bacterium]|nr:phosphatase PAP2 family protein [Alphaproteobacteria bacterium]